MTHLRALRDKYLSSEAAFTKLNLVDATIAQTIQVSGVLKRKARLLKVAMTALGLAVLCMSAGVQAGLAASEAGCAGPHRTTRAAAFDPDPDLITYLERSGKPSEREIREITSADG